MMIGGDMNLRQVNTFSDLFKIILTRIDTWGVETDNVDLESLLKLRDLSLKEKENSMDEKKITSNKSNERLSKDPPNITISTTSNVCGSEFSPYYLEWSPEIKSTTILTSKEKNLVIECKDTDLTEWEGEEYEVVKDKTWSKLMKVLQRNPEQCIRYGGNPVWYQNHVEYEKKQVPDCQYCGAPRVFEFQLMPTLVHTLESTNKTICTGIDFGTIACFTCTKSCDPPKNQVYLTEFYIRQESI